MAFIRRVPSMMVELCVGLPILLLFVAGTKAIEWWERANIRPIYYKKEDK